MQSSMLVDSVLRSLGEKKGRGGAMGRMIGTGTDVVGFLKEQHHEIKASLEQVLAN